MLIIGAKGFAKEVLEIFHQLKKTHGVCFYDDIHDNIPNYLYEKFKVLRSEEEVVDHFDNNAFSFTIGIGNPKLRKQLFNKFKALNGKAYSVISPFSQIGNFGNIIGEGTNIMTGVIITNDVRIGKCCLINLNSTIGHDCVLGDFVELSPNVNVSGRCIIGDMTSIGTNAVILPNIKIGKNCIIGAGAVVTNDLPDNCLAVGIPAVIKKIFNT